MKNKHISLKLEKKMAKHKDFVVKNASSKTGYLEITQIILSFMAAASELKKKDFWVDTSKSELL